MSKSYRRSTIYTFIFFLAILVIVSVDLFIHHRFEKNSRNDKVKLSEKLEAQRDEISQAKKVKAHLKADSGPYGKPAVLTDAEKGVSPEFISQFRAEAAEIGRPQADVEQLENRLQSWARHLLLEEIKYLSEVINDLKKNGDERALALDLLGRNQSQASLSELKDFVLSKENSALDSRARRDEELIFKVQAVEEIAASSSQAEALSYLREIQNLTDQSFVKDRVQRSISHLKGLSAAPEIQDNEALKKLIK
jgi:hypothetical protein